MAQRAADDGELVDAALGGDRDAFGEIFDRYAPRLHAFCSARLGEPHAAADAVQETFVAAARKLEQLADPAALRPWLYAIARNECTRQGRARAKAEPIGDEAVTADRTVAPSVDDPAARAEAGEVGDLLWAAADGLDEKDRTLLELHVRHGLEGGELAEAAGIAPGQISMAVGRMRDRLERAIGALLVARQGRADCPGLAEVLDDWDGRFSVLWRKRVARHVEHCDRCEERRAALVAPLGTLALVPAATAFTLPEGALDGVRERVLEAFDARAARAAPPRRRGLLVAAAILLVALLLGGLAALAGDDPDEVVAGAGDEATTTTVADETTAEPDGGATTTTAAPAPTSPVSAPPTTAAPTTTTSTIAVAPPIGPDAPDVSLPGPGSGPNEAPVITSANLQGSPTMQTSCNLTNSGRTVSVTVSDDRGVANVVLRWVHSAEGPDQVPMLRVGSGWVGSFGPFDEVGTVTYEAVATDTDGATATSPSGTVTVEPCPG